MSRSRLKTEHLLYHVMNRGDKGEFIFEHDYMKEYFLKKMRKYSRLYKISILAYCIMPNHFHLLLLDDHNNLSDFMRTLQSTFAMYYRKMEGGKGYVFQNRFKSLPIQTDAYLTTIIAYILQNPQHKGICSNPFEYKWSSVHEYFAEKNSDIVLNGFVEEYFMTKEYFFEYLGVNVNALPLKDDRYGKYLGDEAFIKRVKCKANRRRKALESSKKRIDDKHEYNTDAMVKEFEDKHKIDFDKNIFTREDKYKWLGKLLVFLRDKYMLPYNTINCMKLYKSYKYSYLRKLYRKSKSRKEQK